MNYIFDFDPISEKKSQVRYINKSTNLERVAGIAIKDRDLSYRVKPEFNPVIGDIIDLAVAIHAADRLAVQDLYQEQSRIEVKLPVREPELLNNQRNKLEDLLEWATGSQWIFDFKQRTTSERLVIEQSALPVVPENLEVALWSGGLDALAGAYTRFRQESTKSFLLVGTGSNNIVSAKQKEVALLLQKKFKNHFYLSRIPIRLYNSNKNKNKIARARVVVFTLIGSACAYLVCQQELCVYENGIGAINLPYRASAIGLDHARSVHPLTLLRVSNFISSLLGETFRVWNPFLFWTKAQMCKQLTEDGDKNLPLHTRSCDHPHRHKYIQCGYCSSCLLRRQALAASKIEDKTNYVLFNGKQVTADTRVLLSHMIEQVRTLKNLYALSASDAIPWELLARQFPILDDIADRCHSSEKLELDEMRQCLIQLYANYVTEWNKVESQLSEGLLSDVKAKALK